MNKVRLRIKRKQYAVTFISLESEEYLSSNLKSSFLVTISECSQILFLKFRYVNFIHFSLNKLNKLKKSEKN